MAVLFVNFILFLIFVLYITRYIYDPLSFESISAEFMKQICDLALCSESILGIILSSVQQQLIDVNILNRFAETGKCFNVGKMRHILKCLE